MYNKKISIDPKIKNQALKKAKKDKVSLNLLINTFLSDYAEGMYTFSVRPLVDENGFSLKQQKDLDDAIKETENPKNLSGPFKNKQKIKQHLDSLKH
jgi:hypothetical protein